MTDFFQAAHAHDHDRAVSLLAQDQYMRELRWMTLADRQEEAQCIEYIKRGLSEQKQPVPNQWQLQVAKQARARLAESYQPLIVHLAKSFARCHTGFELGDFVNEGMLGVLTLLDRLDAYEGINGAALHALALEYVRGAMLTVLRDNNGLVCLSDRVLRALKRLRQVEHDLFEVLQREPTYHEIAHTMQLSVTKVVELLDYQRRHQVESLEGLLEEDTADEYECLDFVGLFEAQVHVDAERSDELSEAVQAAMTTVLSEKQQAVVRLRYGFDEGPCPLRSYTDIAPLLGMHKRAIESSDRKAKGRLGRALAPVFAGSSANTMRA